MRIMAKMVPAGDRPTVLWEAFDSGGVCIPELPELIAFAWLRDDSPTSRLGVPKWLRMFRTVGYFSWPTSVAAPTQPLTLYRGSVAARARGMSWTHDDALALKLGERHQPFGLVQLYQATVYPDFVLAYLGRADEGFTVVVDPAGAHPIAVTDANKD